jgi:hypothetical protein
VVRRRPTPPKADPDAPLANLPAKPETAQPRPGAGAPLTEKEQKAFPLEVVGFTRLEDGGGWRVLVMPRPAEGESPTREYIAFAEGDEWDAPEGGSLQVLSIEGSSVVFEWSDGRRVRIDKDALRDYAPLLREVALPGEAAEAEAEDSPERRPPSLPVLKREESSRPLGASAEKPEPTPLGGEKGPDKTDIWNTKKLSQAELNRLLRSLQNDPELRARMLEKALAAPEE